MAAKKTTRSKENASKKAAKDTSPSARKEVTEKRTSQSKKGVSKQTTTTQAKKNDASKSYKDMIVEALIVLKDRKGSSRPAIKKYIKENYPSVGVAGGFDSYFNNAIKKGVESKEFDLPKGPSGTLVLAKTTPETVEIEKTKKPETRGRPPKPDNQNKGKSEEDSKKRRGRPKLTEVTPKKEETKSNEKTEKRERSRASEKAKVQKSKSHTVEKRSKAKLLPVTYKEMIISGILHLNDGKGSSRSALKKFVRNQYKKSIKPGSNFDHLFNNAIRKGIESGDFHQPRGPSGVVKVLKKQKAQLA